MKEKPALKNVAASVRQRLYDRAREQGDDFERKSFESRDCGNV